MSDSLMTPEWVYRACEDSWGRPALDPCWHPASPVKPRDACWDLSKGSIPKAAVTKWVGLDGLLLDWEPYKDWIWLNPPYSNVMPWLDKAWNGTDAPCAALLKFDPTTKWYRQFVRYCTASVGIFTERLSFGRTDGGKQLKAPFVSCLVLYGLDRPQLDLVWLEK